MDSSDATRQVKELLNLQDQWFAQDGAIDIKTPTLFDRLQKIVGTSIHTSSSNRRRLDAKKKLTFTLNCGVLHPDDLSDLTLAIEFPFEYPSAAICNVKAVKTSNPSEEYSACSAAISNYLQAFIGCECIEMLLDWISDNKSNCLTLPSNEVENDSGDKTGKVRCHFLRYNHLLSGPEHKKEKAMVSEAKKAKLQGGLLWGTPGIVVIVPPSTEEDAKDYASECRTIGKRAEGPTEIFLPSAGIEEAGMGGLAQQKRGGKLQELDTAGLRCGCGGDEMLLKQILGVS